MKAVMVFWQVRYWMEMVLIRKGKCQEEMGRQSFSRYRRVSYSQCSIKHWLLARLEGRW